MGFCIRRDQVDGVTDWLDAALEAEGVERLHIDHLGKGGKTKQVGEGYTREEWESYSTAGAILEGLLDGYGLTAGRYQLRCYAGLTDTGQPRSMPRRTFEVVRDVATQAETPGNLGPIRDLAVELRQQAADTGKRLDGAFDRLAATVAASL